MHGRPTGLFITASPLAFACYFLLQLLELPLPLQLLTVPLLSSQPFSWGLRLQEQGQGFTLARLKLILTITLNTGGRKFNFIGRHVLFLGWTPLTHHPPPKPPL